MAKGKGTQFGLGIDLGGTKILAGVIDLSDGSVVATAKKRTRAERGPGELLDRLGDAASEALSTARLPKNATVLGAGVAAAGQVDPGEGLLVSPPNMPGISNLPIGKELSKRLSLPVRLTNDVQGAAFGELHFGAARDVDRALCVFVGTGVGGTLIAGGRLEQGATATAGEIGHMIVQADGRLCGCGGRGHLEAYASRTAIVRALAGELHRGRTSLLHDLLRDGHDDDDEPDPLLIRSGILAKAFAEEDELTLEIVRDAARFLGLGLASAINLYNPERIVLGGGVVEAIPDLVKLAGAVARREALPIPARKVDFVRAELGDNAGIVGGALLGAVAADEGDARGRKA